MKKGIKAIEQKRNKEEMFDTLFPAMEVLFDPQSFAERLFGTLQVCFICVCPAGTPCPDI